MRIKVERLMDGPGPSEVVIAVATASGQLEQVVVHNAAILDETIEVGGIINQEEDRALIELPRESMSGIWRVWIPVSKVAHQ